MSTSPQLEDGFTRIANELMDAILAFPFSQRQMKVLMTLIRKLYGFNKKRDDISASQIGSVCGIPRAHVTSVLGQLTAMRVIRKEAGQFGCLVEINKNYRDWVEVDENRVPRGLSDGIEPEKAYHYTYKTTRLSTGEFYIGVRSCNCHPNKDRYLGSGNWIYTVKAPELTKEILGLHESRRDAEMAEVLAIQANANNPLLKNSTLYFSSSEGVQEVNTSSSDERVVQEMNTGSSSDEQVGSSSDEHTKDNLPKDNHQKKKSCASNPKRECNPLFARFYEAYPKKRSKQAAERAFAKLNPDEQLVDAMIAAIERAMKSGDWSNPKFIPHPASWLNAAGWLDEVQTHYSDEEIEVIRVFNEALGDQLGVVAEKPFMADRAAAIRDFLTFSQKPDWVSQYFPWIRDNMEIPPKVGFDWTISRQGFSNATSGQHRRKK